MKSTIPFLLSSSYSVTMKRNGEKREPNKRKKKGEEFGSFYAAVRLE